MIDLKKKNSRHGENVIPSVEIWKTKAEDIGKMKILFSGKECDSVVTLGTTLVKSVVVGFVWTRWGALNALCWSTSSALSDRMLHMPSILYVEHVYKQEMTTAYLNLFYRFLE